MRELASPSLHIGGFTNVSLEHPVLDVSGDVSEERATRAVVFFLATALADGAAIARVQCGSAARGRALAAVVRRELRGATERMDDESLALMRYFDVYLKTPDAIAERTGARLVAALGRALRDP